MPKPRMFIGSSSESLEVAYAAQEALERDAEVTVWTQGIFQLSKYTLDDLIDTLSVVDFSLFVLSADDVLVMRDETMRAARDNVIFELGMFIGRLGRERSFILVPRGTNDLHLPSDLLGLTAAQYDADRTDGNLLAALGPAANKIRKVVTALGPLVPPETQEAQANPVPEQIGLIEAKDDCLALIEAWMGQRNASQNREAIRYRDVDTELGMKPGSAKAYIIEAATRWNYRPHRTGEDVITFEVVPRPPSRPSRFSDF